MSPADNLSEQPILAGIRVLDAGGPESMYGARLLADLGADVVRADIGNPEWESLPPLIPTVDGGTVSAFGRFVNLNKRSVWLDRAEIDPADLLSQLADQADVIITDGATAIATDNDAVRVDVSMFGAIGTGAELRGDDLVALAAGGLLSLGGYPDTEPIAVFGNQSLLVGGLLTAIAALLALLARDQDGRGHTVDVSVQAGIVGALEDATAEADLVGTTRRRAGGAPREAGTGTFACSDGEIAIVAGKMGTAKAWDTLIAWMVEAQIPGAAEMADPSWTTLSFRRRPESIAWFVDAFEAFTKQHTKEWLYREGQARGIAIAPVNTIADVRGDDQLSARGYFRTVRDDVLGTELTYPGPAFRLHGYPSRPWHSAPATGADTETVLREWLGTAQAAIDLDATG